MSTTLSCLNAIKRTNQTRPMVKPLYSDTVFHGDHSHSMISMGDSPMKGGRMFVEKYRKMALEEDYDMHLVYGVFSDNYTEIYNGNTKNITNINIDECEKAMTPSGMTKFYDTAIEQLEKQAERIETRYHSLPTKVKKLVDLNTFSSVVFAILTDGDDNLSIQNAYVLKKHLENHKKKYGTRIIFMAANMNAVNIGQSYGLNKDECLQMGSDPHYSFNAMNNMTDACIRQSSQSHNTEELITPLMRMNSCSLDEIDTFVNPPFVSNPILHRGNNQCIPRLQRTRTLSSNIHSDIKLPSIDLCSDFSDNE